MKIKGSQKYAARIQLDPQQLATRQIGLDQVATAIQQGKGLPNKKTSQIFLWGGRLARLWLRVLMLPTPQDWIIYLLSVPYAG